MIVKTLDKPICFVDTETTGLKTYHEIIEIGLVKVKPYTFEEIDRWSIKIKPTNIAVASTKALEINHYTEEEWYDAENQEDAIKMFLQKVDGCIIAGHNISFDLRFIEALLDKYNLTPTYYYKPLDTFSLAYLLSFSDLTVSSLSLDNIAKQLNIKNVTESHFGRFSRHSALYDAVLTSLCFKEMMNRLM